MRLRLGILAFCLCVPTLAVADSCGGIADNGERLACFDAGLACAQMKKKKKRLACYDALYVGFGKAELPETKKTPEASPAPQVTAVETRAGETQVVVPTAGTNTTVPTSDRSVPSSESSKKVLQESDSEENFGKREGIGAPVRFINASIVDVMTNSQRIDYLRLDNGQIWRETEDFRVKYRKGRNVRIEEGILGTFNLRMDGVKKLIKVRRIDE